MGEVFAITRVTGRGSGADRPQIKAMNQLFKNRFAMKRVVSFFARKPSDDDGGGMSFIRIHMPAAVMAGPVPIPIVFLDKGKSKSKKTQK